MIIGNRIVIDVCPCVIVISYNRPKICPFASWNSIGITFANNSTIGSQPNNIFVDSSNAVYVTSQSLNLVRMWSAGTTAPTRNLSGNLNNPYGLFVTIDGDIYVDNGNNGQVDKWAVNTVNSVWVMNVTSTCFSLFVDINDTLYCSIQSQHQVIKLSLNNNSSNISIVAAGTGVPGSTSDMLSSPRGIFVNINLDLYVADCDNDRIQLFNFEQSNATTVAGNGSVGTIALDCPSGIILDVDNYLFIVDTNNHRIIGSGPNGFLCVAGCSGSSGSASNQLNYPQSLAFDSFGNLFVVDRNNSRIQKFILGINFCGKYTNSLLNKLYKKVITIQEGNLD
jgi:hypothetical protein